MNNTFESCLYGKMLEMSERHTSLVERFGEKYRVYRKNWDTPDDSYRETLRQFPIHYDLMLNDNCNMRCLICHSRKRTNKKLERKIIDKIFSEGKEYGLASCAFGLDSESLVDLPLLYYAIDQATKNGVMDIIVCTNGLLLSEEVSENLIDKGVSYLRISLDAASPEVYAKMRSGESLKKVEGNILKFLEIRKKKNAPLPKLRISFCKTSANMHEVNLFIEKWEKIVDHIDIQRYISTFGSVELSAADKANNKQLTFCKDPFRRVGILANGDVQCCCSFAHKDIIVGNIYSSTVFDIWNGEKMSKIQDAFLFDTTQVPTFCKACMASIIDF